MNEPWIIRQSEKCPAFQEMRKGESKNAVLIEKCTKCGRKHIIRPATPVERKLALTDEEIEAEVRRRYNDPKSSFYGKSMWAVALIFEKYRVRDLEADDEQPTR